ncbi:MAG: hypothetical protein QMD85_04375 [Candidatus Aenigmarchaeota archaeon]|nr:hypothetical protein [Candidatus Aenigmarchaeota archaeon]MDI6722808.1 hypothetical protein [Candidatus Aenigmarchaeota archaeon]
MPDDFIMGTVEGWLSFGVYSDVVYAITDEIKDYIALLGSDEFNYYKGRMVSIKRDSIHFPGDNYGILGTYDYSFPDRNRNISPFVPVLKKSLGNIDVNAKYSVIDEKGEDSFLYGISTFDVDNRRVFFLRLTCYSEEEDAENRFERWMNTPYSRLALCFEEGKAGIMKSENYIEHFAKHFWLMYKAYILLEGKHDEALGLIRENNDLKAMDDELGKALSDPQYMEALCCQIEKTVEARFFCLNPL